MSFERTCDVLVLGGGVAGIAAALESARAGMRTLLVEKTLLPGGLATSGLVNGYLPLCDGCGHQVTFGIAEEFLHLSIRYGPGDVPACWRESPIADGPAGRYSTPFSPASFVLALDEVILDAGVEVWFDTAACAPVLEGDRLAGVEVENKSGRGLLRAACTIDATGDADLACRAGVPCVEGRNNLTIWAVELPGGTAVPYPSEILPPGPLNVVRLGGSPVDHGSPPIPSEVCGIDGRKVTEFALEGRRLLRERYAQAYAREGPEARHRLFPVTLPTMPQFRTIRRIVGRTTLPTDAANASHADSIGMAADWRRSGEVWEVPYGCLVPEKVGRLLVAGRCIAAEGNAWEVTRSIPGCAMTGQAAGIAATLAIRRGTSPEALSAEDVQRELRARRIPLHRGDVGL